MRINITIQGLDCEHVSRFLVMPDALKLILIVPTLPPTHNRRIFWFLDSKAHNSDLCFYTLLYVKQ